MLNFTKTYLAHLFCGIGLALALPPLSLLIVGLLALLVLAVLNRDLSLLNRRSRFLRGSFFGFGYFAFALHWIGYAFLVDADSYLWMMPFAVGGLALFMALYWGVAFVVAGWLAQRHLPSWLALPASLSVVELLRGYLFTGFPWAAPGLIADGMGGVLQLASVIGMPGLTCLVLLWGMAAGVLWQFHSSGFRSMLSPVLVLVSLPLAHAWGEWRVSNLPLSNASGPMIRLVQPNISQSDKWRSENAAGIFDDLLALSTAQSDVSPVAILWPESALSFLLDESETALRRIDDALSPGQVLVTGAIRRSTPADAANYFTSIQVIDDRSNVVSSYDKWRLVPGGEYLPFAWVLEPLGFRKVVNLPESFSAGVGPRLVHVPGVGLAGMLICYEAIFPHKLVPEGERARWLVNVTNDGWFGTSVGPYQHLAQVRMRAVEQGLPMARSANTGISALIDPVGRYVVKTELLQRTHVDGRLPESLPPTLFARFGIFPAFAIFALVFGFLGYLRREDGQTI